jgi:hypothetical protein
LSQNHFNMSYLSNRNFQIWTYSAGHSLLVIRSPNNEDDETKGYNIDIEFWGVCYLDLPNILRGVTIEEIQDNVPEKFSKYSSSLGYKVFKIKSKGSIFYVLAAGYRVGKNNWGNEDRISNPNLEYDEIVAASYPD